MTNRTYRTAQGKIVDLGALQLKNENVRAVGNMSVNARGDLLDSYNRSIDSRNQQVAKQYQKQVTNVNDSAVISSKKKSTAVPAQTDVGAAPVESAVPVAAEPGAEPAVGLAAAIARARQVKQEPEQTQSQLTRQTNGVKKI
jgi:hypothetical protein